MENQVFADGIGRISVIGGVVRLDLMTYSATETDAQGQPRPILNQRIVMSMEGFLRSSEKILEAVQALKQKPHAPMPQQPAPPAPQPPAPPPTNLAAPPRPPEKTDNAAPAAAKPSPWSEPLTPKLPFP